MSAFLGPIHFWLYNKIELQNKLVDEIMELAKTKGFDNLKEQLDEAYGVLENRPLEEIIDEGNIHGWLQSKVSVVEYKLAKSVTLLLEKDTDSLKDMEKLFFNNGETQGEILAREEGLTMSTIYKAISDSLLDGMPCDHAVQVVKNEADEVEWKRIACVHTSYWNEVKGDINHYYLLREAWLAGFAKAVGVHFVKKDALTYSITRGE